MTDLTFIPPGSDNKQNYETINEFFNHRPRPFWDNNQIGYDLEKFPFRDGFLNLAQEINPAISDLEELHLYFNANEELELKRLWEKYSNSDYFSKLIDQFIKENLEKHFEDDIYMVQRTLGIRITRPGQEKIGRLVTYHNGYWNGYTNHLYSIWVPLTRAFDSNTLWQTSWEDSRRIIQQIHQHQWDLQKVSTEARKVSFPCNINYGQAWLFSQGHLHGTHNNDSDITRCSFDFRCAIKGNPSRPSFYRFPGDSLENETSKIRKSGRWVVYVDINTQALRYAPTFMVREYLVQFAKTHNIKLNDWKNEYWYCEWMPHFLEIMQQGNIDGIVMLSIFGWTVGPARTLELIRSAVSKGVQMVFVNENLVISGPGDIKQIERRFDFLQTKTI